jgi:RHS repeat-associated protein
VTAPRSSKGAGRAPSRAFREEAPRKCYSSGSQWGETFGPTATAPGVAPTSPGIDSWGNLTNREGVTGKTNYEPLSVSAGTNNRLSGFGYDAAANMTSNGSATYVYDDENRLIATAANSYIYDGDGERVEKCTEGTTPGTCATSATGTMYWRGAGSDPLSETDLAGNLLNVYIFFGGQRIARSDSTGGIHYYFSDHLGSHGVVENATGSACEQDVDYYPYGGEENDYCTTPVAQNYKFTGKERDAESGLDNFGARSDASSLGRFMSADPGGFFKHLIDPQGLNRYAYARDNPLIHIDPDGKDWQTAWNDLKTFGNSVYTKMTFGAGLGGKSKVGTGEAKAEVNYKATLKFSTSAVSLSHSSEASAEAGTPGGPTVGASKGSEQMLRSVNSDGTVTAPETAHATGGLSAGSEGTSVSSSTEEVGFVVEEGVGILAGFEIGATREGWQALGDAFSNVKDEVVPPSPPPPATPGPPTAASTNCDGGGGAATGACSSGGQMLPQEKR